ncbi:MAG: hypothetical protein ACI8S6_005934 [Myxococcota bacterium]|jgi:hypothetical protein
MAGMFLSILLACGPAPLPPPVEEPPPVVVRDPAPHLQLQAFFMMGEKVHSSAAPADQQAWATALLGAIGDGSWEGEPRDLLRSSGGGPSGAEWNADADLYIVGYTNLSALPIEATLALNGELSGVNPTISRQADRALLAWRLPHTVWSAALRPIGEDADYLLLFSEEERIPYQGRLTDSPLSWGEILRLQLTVRSGSPPESRTTEQAFHIAQGE